TALSSTSIRITWNAVSGATSYKIYSPETSGSASNFVELDTSTTNSYTDNYLRAGQTWYYKVSAVNSAGESAQSSSVSAKTPSSGGSGGNTGGGGTTTSKPNAPYGSPSIDAETSNSLTLEWNASLNATGYKLYRSSSISSSFVEVYSGSATTFRDTGVISGVTYNYKVTATNSAGESGYSDVFTYMKQ
ncbi:MAG: fibronectin type III domain-containing protein, partial [Treponema sp.]|nr:fibronectin type III domain-containing protein [Treponema sp.]